MIASNDNDLADFELLRYRRRDAAVTLTGACYQIAVDGQPRSNRDDKAIAIEAAEYLKYKHPHAEVTVHDLMTGDTITIKTLPPGRKL